MIALYSVFSFNSKIPVFSRLIATEMDRSGGFRSDDDYM